MHLTLGKRFCEYIYDLPKSVRRGNRYINHYENTLIIETLEDMRPLLENILGKVRTYGGDDRSMRELRNLKKMMKETEITFEGKPEEEIFYAGVTLSPTYEYPIFFIKDIRIRIFIDQDDYYNYELMVSFEDTKRLYDGQEYTIKLTNESLDAIMAYITQNVDPKDMRDDFNQNFSSLLEDRRSCRKRAVNA